MLLSRASDGPTSSYCSIVICCCERGSTRG